MPRNLDLRVEVAFPVVEAKLQAALGEILDVQLADTVAVNLRAVFVATQAAVKHMKEGGRVITIGSCNAERVPFAGGSVYAMGKAALVGLVKGLARDLGPRGSRSTTCSRDRSTPT